MIPHFPRSLVLLAVATALAGGACSSSSETSTTVTSTPGTTKPAAPSDQSPSTTVAPNPTPVAGTAITINGFAFQPDNLAAKVGDTITVTNTDNTQHTLSAVDGSFDTTPFSSGQKTFVVSSPGDFEFKCQIHSFMRHGFIHVSASP